MKISANVILICLFITFAGFHANAADPLEEYKQKKEKLAKEYIDELAKVEKFARKNGLDFDCLYLAKDILLVDPGNKAAAETVKNTKKETKTASFDARAMFSANFAKNRLKYSNAYFNLADWCEKKKLEKESKQMLEIALKLNSDNAKARKKNGQVNMGIYGWMDVEKAKKIQAGYLEDGGKWIPKDAANKTHSSWENAWEIKGVHFTVKTDVSYEEGMRVMAAAEELYELFTFELGRYVEIRENTNLYAHFYATLKEYHKCIPKEITAPGVCTRNIAHFSNEKAEDLEPKNIMSHELAHLICYNRIGDGGIDNRQKPGQWLVEGFAMLFDSSWQKAGYGLFKFGFASEGRKRGYIEVLGSGFIPLEEFTVKTPALTAKNASLFHGAARMLYLNEKYRPGLIRMVCIVHNGAGKTDTFEKEIGVKPADLNESLKNFLASPPN